MNPLLARQLRKLLPESIDSEGPIRALLDAVSKAYDELEGDRRLLEHTLEVASDELNAANDCLRVESEHRLMSLSQHYLHTLECQEGMVARVSRTDAGFVHTLCRGKLVARMGWTPEQVEGYTASHFVSPSNVPILEAIYARVWAGAECDQEYEKPDGSMTLFAHFQPLREEGRIVEIIVSAIDVTERKKGELAMLQAKEKAESADRAKSEFLAVMSHEIRTPLNAVLGFNSLLQESPLTEDQHAWVETINQSGRALLGLLNDILDFSKVEAGQLHFSLQPCQLLPLVNSVLSLFKTETASRGVRLKLEMAPDLPEAISTDPARLRQVLLNLISNAVKFTHEGQIRIQVNLSASAVLDAPRTLRVIVSDTGIGIDAKHHSRIFTPFSQADSSSTRQYGGTGLGLAISQRLARALGGDITFTSIVGEGSTFTLSLPVGQATLGSSLSALVEAKPIRSSLRVLVAEDHPHNRALILRILGRQNIEPDLVENGNDAVEAAVLKVYDIIFMDVRMPGKDGMEATRQIRARISGRKIPRIVAVTANAFEEEKRRCFDAGMDAVILKPFVVAELLAQLAIADGGGSD